MKAVLKRILRGVFSDYQLNRVYTLDLSAGQCAEPQASGEDVRIGRLESSGPLSASDDQRMRDHAWYLDGDAEAYGVFEGEQLTCVTCFWPAGHDKLPSRFGDLGAGCAVMVDLLTTPQARGKGYAALVTRYAQWDLGQRGYTTLWTWVWHSNAPSIRVFEKAGWRYAYFLAEFKLSGMKDYLRFRRDRS